MARRAGGALVPAVQHRARFRLLRRADAARRAGREGRADAGPGRKVALADHRFRCTERPGRVTAPHRRDHRALCPQISERGEIPPIAYQETRDVDIATITGVGSSALGSAALAWDISVALEKPVLAIVPGYGVADVVLQGLGGWLAFGLHDFLSSKTLIQTGLATCCAGDGAHRPGACRLD